MWTRQATVCGVREYKGFLSLYRTTSSMPWSSIISIGRCNAYKLSGDAAACKDHTVIHVSSLSLSLSLSFSLSSSPSLHVGEDALQMDLWSSSVSSDPRYTLSVVDLHKRKGKNGPFAIFIVPQGRYM